MASHQQTPCTSLETGDRFEVSLTPDGRTLILPQSFSELEQPIDELLGPDGNARPFRLAHALSSLELAEPLGSLPSGTESLWLEYREPGRFHLLAHAEAPEAAPQLPAEHGVQFTLNPEDEAFLRSAARQRASLPLFALAREAAQLSTNAGFDRLICLPQVRDMELLDHQIRTAKTVLQRFHGKAMLCDEVGLGKTIEAGLIAAELRLRGLIRSILVLVPPSLIEQWQGEMRRKFSLELTSHDDPVFRDRGPAAWNEFDYVIASIHTAKRDPHRTAITARHWDLVIVDEAHHLRNRNTLTWRLASELQKQYALLLTATPVQNNLEELFNLVTLLEPGLLRTAKQFQKRFVDKKDKLTPLHLDELHQLLAEVMVRNRRSNVGLQFTRRWARTERIASAAPEQQLYDAVATFIRPHLRKDSKSVISRMALLSLQMALGSSSQAAASTLAKLADTPKLPATERETLLALAAQASAQKESAKVDRLLQLLKEFPDKLVLFTQFRATQEMLQKRLTEAGHTVAVFHGGLSRLGKEASINEFRGVARLLIATESGSEGRNLQFAHALCNFDLPWNPMRIEQRVGRLSRIGQTRDIEIFNFVTMSTVEEAVLHLLQAKLNLFELVIGEIDMILGNLEEEREFEDVVADLWAESDDMGDFRKRMEDLGDRLLQAKGEYQQQQVTDNKIFGDRFAPDQ
ncbi:MAG: helicase SNF2 [Planctomycetaceae bacterium]|nr:helicase SNF2 [Planctomycetaceae bacterium]